MFALIRYPFIKLKWSAWRLVKLVFTHRSKSPERRRDENDPDYRTQWPRFSPHQVAFEVAD